MRPRIYYLVTNTDDKSTVYVNTPDEIENITGIEANLFRNMEPAQLIIINHWEIICDQTMPKTTMYYKNLWRD